MYAEVSDDVTLSVMLFIYEMRGATDFLSEAYMVFNISGAPTSPRTLTKMLHGFKQAEETE